MQHMKMIFRCMLLALVFLPLLMGQSETGSMVGTVTDPSGAVVPGAEVTVRNTGTSVTFVTVTDGSGFWRAPQLIPGVYEVSVTATGFSTTVRKGIEVRVADRLRVDVVLKVGTLSETVEVTGTAPLLQVEDAALGQVIDNKNIVDLPLNGRNWLQLATLAPATVVTSPGAAAGGLSLGVNIGGLSSNQTQFLLDGADNTNLIAAGAAYSPPIDALQEFKVQSNNFTADAAGYSGAVLNAVVKSGTNEFHGNAYEFFRNNVLNARNFFALPTAAKPQFNRNQFGASIGGPFRKNKLFFFLNYDANRQRQANVTTTTVFTDAQKAGNFASALGPSIGTDALGRAVPAGAIYDPFSLQILPSGAAVRDPFPGNIIPPIRINKISKTLIDMVPPPMLPSAANNYVRSISNPLDSDNFLGRVDWAVSSSDNIFTHLGYTSQWNTTDCLFSPPVCGGVGSGGINDSENRQASLGWTHTFSPTIINEFRSGYTRTVSIRDLLDSSVDYNGKYGIPFPYQGPHTGGLAYLSISGYTGIGAAASGGPYFQFVNKYELSDNLTVLRGKHSLKFGFKGSLKLFHNQRSMNYGHGNIDFMGLYTRQIGVAATGSSIADFLLGTGMAARYGNIVDEKDVWRDIEGYAQDKWIVTPKLTVTVGVRYFNNPPSWENRDEVASVLTDLGYRNAVVVVPQGMAEDLFVYVRDTLFPFIKVRRAPELTRSMTLKDYGYFAPRLGIAYQLNKKVVLRTGYGIFYGFPEQVGGNILGVNPPQRLVVSSSANGITPTILIDQPVFGAEPFNRPLVNPDFLSVRNPYSPPEMTQMYNLSIQYEFKPGWLLEVGYQGNRSTHLYVNTQINDAIPALPGDTSSIQSRRIASTKLGNVPLYAPQGSSLYNAGTINLEKRFAGGLGLVANYTWSRALGNTAASAQSPFDLRNTYGPLAFDVRNHVSMSAVSELPFGRGKKFLSHVSPAVNLIVGGWQVNAISTLQGGLRTTPSLSYSLGNTTTNSRPNCIADPTVGAARQPYQWINAAAFAIPSNAEIAAGNFFGNCGAGVIALPGMVNFDVSVLKNFMVRERYKVQFRAESFNFTNTPYFGLTGFFGGSLGTIYGLPNFGKLSSAADPRIIQLGLKVMF